MTTQSAFTPELKTMLYVSDVEKATEFWRSIGFVETAREEINFYPMVELASEASSSARLVLFSMEFIEKFSPEVKDNVPSLMFFTEDIESLHAAITAAGATVTPIQSLPTTGHVMSFADPDGHYFAVTQNTQQK